MAEDNALPYMMGPEVSVTVRCSSRVTTGNAHLTRDSGPAAKPYVYRDRRSTFPAYCAISSGPCVDPAWGLLDCILQVPYFLVILGPCYSRALTTTSSI